MEKKLEALGWSLIFIWLGIYFLFQSPREGLFTLGMGVIILLENGLRAFYKVRVSKFWVAVGILFSIIGILDYYSFHFVPFLLISSGAFILYRYVIRKEPS